MAEFGRIIAVFLRLPNPPVSDAWKSGYVGGVPERSKGTDCKSVGIAFTGSNPVPPTEKFLGFIGRKDSKAWVGCGCSSMVEQQPSKLKTRVRFPSPALEKYCLAGRISGLSLQPCFGTQADACSSRVGCTCEDRSSGEANARWPRKLPGTASLRQS